MSKKGTETLETFDLTKSYNGRIVVDGVNLKIRAGEVVGLLGPNGAGKTTTFYMIVGLIAPNEGKIFVDDREITKEPVYKRARLGIGYLSQEASVFRKLSVEDNLYAVLEMSGLPREQQMERAEELLREFGLVKIRKSLGIQLSGGERRRTEIARALATDPRFILLDEPFAGVDPVSVIEIQQLIKHLQSKSIGVLITDHNVREILKICDRAYILNDGQILTAGSAEAVLANQTVREVYLGHDFRL